MTPRKPDADDSPALTDEDIRWVQEQRKMDAHAQWLRGQVRVIWPWVVSILGAVVTAAIWIRDHVKW